MPEVVFLRLHVAAVAAVAGAFTCTEGGPQDDDFLCSKRAPLSNAATRQRGNGTRASLQQGQERVHSNSTVKATAVLRAW